MRRGEIPLAVALAATLTAIAACGGSDNGHSAGKTSTTEQSAAQAITSSGANDTMPLDSAAYRSLVATAAGQKGLSPPIAAKVADCIVKKETAQGYRTVADVARSATARQQAVQDAAECTTQALPAG